MCGIAGIVALSGAVPSRTEVEAMCDAMVHRGPDDAGYMVRGPVAFGMRRLSIIDVAGGHQPIFNEDRTVGVVCNGEIYNYRELRAWLESKGHTFRTGSDTEVIAHLWEQTGIDFPRYLNGMFAVALYDQVRETVVLVRDHAGIKPLYYQLGPDGLIFASEIKAILASRRVTRRLDVDGLAQFLSWEYVPGPGTLLKGMLRVEPAHSLEIDVSSGGSRIRRYWSPLDGIGEAAPQSTEDWADELDAVIGSAVRRQLVSDVPVGAFLSGGVDSSLVAANMGATDTFSIGFEEPSYDESRWSSRVAAHLGVRHHIETIRPNAVDLFGQLMHFMDDPIADFSIFPTYLVSRLARRHVKVVLTGDGGDELFGGYETFLAEEKFRSWRRLPAWLRASFLEPIAASLPPTAAKKGLVNKAKRFVEGARLDPALGHARWRVFCDETLRAKLLTPAANLAAVRPVNAHIAALKTSAAGLGPRDQALFVDFNSYLVDNCLAKVDRMSMACSLEARVPLLDREVIELAFRLPVSLKFDARRTKILLKRVAARHVPGDCVYRAKQGFSIPMKSWLKSELRGVVEHYLAPDRLSSAGLFEPAVVQRLRREHEAGQGNHSHLLWALLVFEQWRERWGVTA
jgi:asparagine synthase (glutamine-hydrolysing)